MKYIINKKAGFEKTLAVIVLVLVFLFLSLNLAGKSSDGAKTFVDKCIGVCRPNSEGCAHLIEQPSNRKCFSNSGEELKDHVCCMSLEGIGEKKEQSIESGVEKPDLESGGRTISQQFPFIYFTMGDDTAPYAGQYLKTGEEYFFTVVHNQDLGYTCDLKLLNYHTRRELISNDFFRVDNCKTLTLDLTDYDISNNIREFYATLNLRNSSGDIVDYKQYFFMISE